MTLPRFTQLGITDSDLFELEEQGLDRGAILGMVLCGVLVAAGIASGGGALMQYIDLPSCALVLGGSIGAALIQFSLLDMQRALTELKISLFTRTADPAERILYLVRLAAAVRTDGMLVLERERHRVQDWFLRIAFELAADAEEIADIRTLLETEMYASGERSARAVQVLHTIGGYAPAMGLIGTLLGLIRMLGSLNNPSTIGPAMSLALVATLYGAIASNFLFLPLAGRLKSRADEDHLVKLLTLEGVLCLTRKESPIVVEQRLRTFLAQGRDA